MKCSETLTYFILHASKVTENLTDKFIDHQKITVDQARADRAAVGKLPLDGDK